MSKHGYTKTLCTAAETKSWAQCKLYVRRSVEHAVCTYSGCKNMCEHPNRTLPR